MSGICCVINTCAGGHAGGIISSGKQPYAERAWLLRNVTLPLYTTWMPELFQQVIVVGEWEEGEGYTYVPCPSKYKSCVDALAQRQAGYEAMKNHACPWILFQHDDHLWDPRNEIPARMSADVLSPSRWTHGRSTEDERLNDGSFHVGRTPKDTLAFGYLNGHACLMRPSVFRNGFNWNDAEKIFQWDLSVTSLLQSLGNRIHYMPYLKVYDMERNAKPWL